MSLLVLAAKAAKPKNDQTLLLLQALIEKELGGPSIAALMATFATRNPKLKNDPRYVLALALDDSRKAARQ